MIAILDYGAGNLTSVQLALKHLGADTVTVPDAQSAEGAGKLIFPGVGSAASGMNGLRERQFDQLLADAFAAGKPVFAICLGMQMLLDFSEEDNGVKALGLIPGMVRKFSFEDPSVKVPHIGWNTVEHDNGHPLWQGIPSGTAFYFVHSYYAETLNGKDSGGTTEYAGKRFTSVLSSGSFFATQFHPERSGSAGMRLLQNFLDWKGETCC